MDLNNERLPGGLDAAFANGRGNPEQFRKPNTYSSTSSRIRSRFSI
ncbi:MAG: hypothetical protein ACJAZF_003924, partial [Granulosicoccus sp.]